MLWKTMFVSSVFVLWCFICQQWYVCGIKQSCKKREETTQKDLPATKNKEVANLPISFHWANEKAITNKQFSVVQDTIIKRLGSDEFLEITGFYFEDEVTDSTDLGRKRAAYVKTLFIDKVPANRILLRSEMLQEMKGVRENLFESVSFKVIDQPIAIQDGENGNLIMPTKEGVLLYFPFNSTNKELDPKLDGYLQQLSTRLRSGQKKVHIIGHTDNVGDAKVNYEIGRQRAKKIRSILMKSGVSRAQITVFSKGETEPLGTNETEEGRQKNRRTEIKIFD